MKILSTNRYERLTMWLTDREVYDRGKEVAVRRGEVQAR